MNRRHARGWGWVVLGFSGVLLAASAAPWRPVRAQDQPKESVSKEKKSDEPAKKSGLDREISDLDAKIAELAKQREELEKKRKESSAEASKAGSDRAASWIKELKWRQVGPANMGGRIVALAVPESDPSTWFVGTATGGLLKTTNNGVTFTHGFDREASVSIGDVAVAPSDPNIVWVGTGENNARNSVSYGDGVYKSKDGGKTWTNMGLKEGYQIGRIVIHPRDPNTVYVGVLGRLFGPSTERGLFKTTDGGTTWKKVHFVDDKTGVIDIRMHPTDPDTLIFATYERKRGIYDEGDPIVKWGAGTGLYKTTDGGKTFKKLSLGLPTVKLGRIGIDWYRKDPRVVFAIIETEKIGTGPPQPAGTGNAFMGIQGEDREDRAFLSTVIADGPADKAGLKSGDAIAAIGDKPIKNYEALLTELRERKPGDEIKVKIEREGKPIEIKVTLGARPTPAGGGSAGAAASRLPFGSGLGGQRENAQDRQGADGFQTGGVFKSSDGGESWTRINSLNPRPFYFSQVRVDPSDDQKLYVLGVSMYRSSDGGKTFRPDGGRGVHADQHALWIDPKDGRHMLVGCDGGLYATFDRMDNWDHYNHLALGQFYDVAVDTHRDYHIYGGLQDNGTWGGPSRTKSGTGPINEDWVSISGGDGFQCQVDPDDPHVVYATSQYGAMLRRNLATGETARIRPTPEKDQKLRFNWNTPFALSHHNGRIFYCAGNYLWKSLDRGNDLRRISPEITRTDQGSATGFAESPKNPDVLYVGTDDGALWITRNGGKDWSDLTKKLGLDGPPRTVASIEASRFAEGRVYLALNGRRMDDDRPRLFVSQDFGEHWTDLAASLPRGSTYCLREDVSNEDLLFVGTEFGAWVSLDRGSNWQSLNNNLPTVAVHDFAIHPGAGELVAATHGRSIWILDIAALRQINAKTLAAKATLFQPVTAIRWIPEPTRGRTNRRYVGENPSPGVTIAYALTTEPEKISLRIVDHEGKTVRELRASKTRGLHQAQWDLTRTATATAGARKAAAPKGSPPAGRAPGNAPGRPVNSGLYHIVLTVDGVDSNQTLRLLPDPSAPGVILAAEATNGAGEEFNADKEEEEDEERPID